MNTIVIVLNWNGAQDTLECLASLEAQQEIKFQLVVVDNGSTDNSVVQIKSNFPDVIVLENQENLGYPGGMNVGLRYALLNHADYILFMNNDTYADSHMVKYLIEALQSSVDVVSPAIFYADCPDMIWSVGGSINPVLLEMTSPHGGDIPLPDCPVKRDFVTGCAIMLKAEVLKDIGFMDERFFPGYYEDLDFCLRVSRKGYRTFLIPQAHLWHKVSRSSGGSSAPKVYYLMARNSGFYFRKHMNFWQVPWILVFRLASALKTSLRLLRDRNQEALKAYWKGLVHGWLVKLPGGTTDYLKYYSKSPEGK